MSDQLQAIVQALIADPDNEITEPEFNVRGTISCWVKVDQNGTPIEFEFDRGGFTGYAEDVSFARDAETSDDGPSLTPEDVAVLDAAINQNEWELRKVEDTDGNVYWTEGF